MKRGDVRKPSSVFYIGKGLIVASIVLTASLGFLLGFFVGKKFHPVSDRQSAGIILAEGPEESGEGERVEEFAPQRPDSGTEQLDGEMKVQQESLPVVQTPENAQTIPLRKEQDKPRSTPAPKAKQTGINTDKTKIAKTPVARKYTVQIGAFKNPDEADALRTRMSKKGYKAFVTAGKTQKQELLHKVMVGSYATRKEAEVLSIKLRNSEGLRTFVTFVMQEATARYR